jgi:hypothetical protein
MTVREVLYASWAPTSSRAGLSLGWNNVQSTQVGTQDARQHGQRKSSRTRPLRGNISDHDNRAMGALAMRTLVHEVCKQASMRGGVDPGR